MTEQRIGGMYRLITVPKFYGLVQDALGAQSARSRYFREWVNTSGSEDVLDVGCGPGVALKYMNFASYTGVDLNLRHIEAARKLGHRSATFLYGDAVDVVASMDRTFDVVLSLGFLHHLNDEHAAEVLNAARSVLKPGGRAYFLEPVWLPRQRIVARWLKNRDSGQHIRTQAGYCELLESAGFRLETAIRHDLLRLPYDHFWGCLVRK